MRAHKHCVEGRDVLISINRVDSTFSFVQKLP